MPAVADLLGNPALPEGERAVTVVLALAGEIAL